MEVADEVFDIHITNPPPIVTPTTMLNTNKTMTTPKLPQFNPSVLVCVAISGQRAGVSLYCFFGNQGEPTATLTQIEKGAWPRGPLPTIRPAPRPWPFVEQSKPTILLRENDKPDVTHIHGRANENDVPTYGTTLMASESPSVEQKPHDGDNQVTVLVDSGASGTTSTTILFPSSSTVYWTASISPCLA